MKKCSQCGSLNGNNLFNCSECNNKLGEPLTKEEEEVALLEQENLKKQDDTYQEDTYIEGFIVTLADKIAVGVAALGIILSVVFIGIESFTENERYFISILSFILCILVSLCSNFFWRLRFIMYRDFYLEPSDFAMGLRKAFIYIFLLIGYILIVS